MKATILFTSTEGNTKSFIDKLQKVFDENNDELTVKEIGPETDYENEHDPYVIIIPTYLNGGTGTGPEVKEIFTNDMGDYIDFNNNSRKLLGIVGNGNRNFNVQYDLTAKRYAEKYNKPLLFEYELRGSKFDAQKLHKILGDTFNG